MNNQSEVDNILGILKKTGTATHLKEMDITWDLNNQLVNSIEMLNILLTKTSCLPLVPDFTDPNIMKTLNMNLQQAQTIQGFNKELLYISGIVQKYIIENYVILSVSKKMMDDTIDQLPQTDMSYLINFLNNYENQQLFGGGSESGFLKNLLFIFILLLISSNSEIETTIDSKNLAIIDDTKNMYSKGLIMYSPEDFTDKLLQQPVVSSGPVNINNMLVKYDAKVQKELETTYGQFVSLFRKMDNSTAKLQNFLNDFNIQSRNFSQGVERNCLELMTKCKEKNVFKEWTNIDTLDETEQKINDLDKKLQEENEGMVGKAFGAAVGFAAFPFTGDYMTPVAYITGLGDDVYEMFKNSNNIIREKKKQILSEQETSADKMKLSPIEQIAFEHKIYQFSKVYCSLGYNLQIVANDTSISIQGDSVPYLFMINLIVTLDKNLDLQITQLTTLKPSEENHTTIQALISLKQRLYVLKAITESLDTIINITSKIQLVKLNKYADGASLNELEQYFNDQLAELRNMLNDLNKQFPLRAKKLEEE